MILYCTENPGFGFHGTIAAVADIGTATALYDMAARAIGEATGTHNESACVFLDSRHGRHFGDSVSNFLHQGADSAAAIASAIGEWMRWPASKDVRNATGAPKGTPYLMAIVGHIDMQLDEVAADRVKVA